jgi:hypothetical protein
VAETNTLAYLPGASSRKKKKFENVETRWMPSTRGGLCPSALRQLSAPVTAPIPNQVGKLFGDPGIRERGGVSPMTMHGYAWRVHGSCKLCNRYGTPVPPGVNLMHIFQA